MVLCTCASPRHKASCPTSILAGLPRSHCPTLKELQAMSDTEVSTLECFDDHQDGPPAAISTRTSHAASTLTTRWPKASQPRRRRSACTESMKECDAQALSTLNLPTQHPNPRSRTSHACMQGCNHCPCCADQVCAITRAPLSPSMLTDRELLSARYASRFGLHRTWPNARC